MVRGKQNDFGLESKDLKLSDSSFWKFDLLRYN